MKPSELTLTREKEREMALSYGHKCRYCRQRQREIDKEMLKGKLVTKGMIELYSTLEEAQSYAWGLHDGKRRDPKIGHWTNDEERSAYNAGYREALRQAAVKANETL